MFTCSEGSHQQRGGVGRLPRAGAFSCFAISPAAGTVPGTEEALCEINICVMNGYKLYKVRVLWEPRGGAWNLPGGGTQGGSLESAKPELSVKEGSGSGRGLMRASAAQAKGTECLESQAQSRQHKESKAVGTARDPGRRERRAAGCRGQGHREEAGQQEGLPWMPGRRTLSRR